jgi:hypothetical protein
MNMCMVAAMSASLQIGLVIFVGVIVLIAILFGWLNRPTSLEVVHFGLQAGESWIPGEELVLVIQECDRVKASGDFCSNTHCLIATATRRIVGSGHSIHCDTFDVSIDDVVYRADRYMGCRELMWDYRGYSPAIVGKTFRLSPDQSRPPYNP